MNSDELSQYLTGGIEKMLTGALRASIQNPRQTAFLLRFAPAACLATSRRVASEKDGRHTPAFMIASITSRCNLHCEGCYARSNASCHDGSAEHNLTADEWNRIFAEARDMGISFVLLAGGEPFLCPDVLKRASTFPDIIFPVFTNGTMLRDESLELLDHSRNLIPILSVEGDLASTDRRRGDGVFSGIETAMRRLKERKIFFGVSVTVAEQNLAQVTSEAFLSMLRANGVRLLLFVEYVSVSENALPMPLTETGRAFLRQETNRIRKTYEDLLVLSFPGDELASGGCLAAGRGFIHINPEGGAEPCPFSPYSDANLRNMSLREALDSGFFRRIRDAGFLGGTHAGGCVLAEHDREVRELRGEEK